MAIDSSVSFGNTAARTCRFADWRLHTMEMAMIGSISLAHTSQPWKLAASALEVGLAEIAATGSDGANIAFEHALNQLIGSMCRIQLAIAGRGWTAILRQFNIIFNLMMGLDLSVPDNRRLLSETFLRISPLTGGRTAEEACLETVGEM